MNIKFYSASDLEKVAKIAALPKKQRRIPTKALAKEMGRSYGSLYCKVRNYAPDTKAVKVKSTGVVFSQNGVGGFKFPIDPQSLEIISENGIAYFKGKFKTN